MVKSRHCPGIGVRQDFQPRAVRRVGMISYRDGRSGDLAVLATAYVLLMAIIGPIAARVTEPLVRWVAAVLRPQPE